MPSAPPPTVHWSVRFQDFLSPKTPVDALKVRMCDLADVACATPVFEKTTDSDGRVELDLPTEPGGIKGYLELTGPAVQPTLWFPRLRSPESTKVLFVSLLDTGTAAALRGGQPPAGRR